MTCKMALELVEPIASGDLEPDAAARAHFESCPQCASALATARRLEAVLAGRAAPAAPERFTSSVLQRIRRERWRAEQHVDRLFNVAIAVALLLITGGILALMNMSGRHDRGDRHVVDRVEPQQRVRPSGGAGHELPISPPPACSCPCW